MSFLGRRPLGRRGSRRLGPIHGGFLKVLKDFEGAEEHAVGGFDAALEAAEGFERVLISVAEG